MKIRVSIVIDAPPDTVWRAVEPIERHVEWMADAERIEFTGATRRGVGTTFDCRTKIGPFRTTDRMVVTDWKPNRTMGIEHRGLFTGRGQFALAHLGRDRTRFTWTEQLEFPLWLGGAAGALAAKPILRRVWRANLRRLKALVEST